MRVLIYCIFLRCICKFGEGQLSNFLPQNSAPAFSPRTDNLYNFDTNFDVRLSPKDAQIGRQIDLLFWFPFYGSRYNYTVISKNGFVAFAQVFEEGLDINVGPDVNWPEIPDPAMIAPYMCPQKYATQTFGGQYSGVRYKLLVRPDLLRQKNVFGSETRVPAFQKLNKEINYIQANRDAATLLDKMKSDLEEGMVGAENFRPDIALVVTWLNMTYAQASAQDEADKAATYQMVLLTDRMAQLSYVILNYHSLNFAGSDIMGNMKRGRCTALLNGGNQTGSVFVDPMHTRDPKKLAALSAVPHAANGRYLFRVDDVVKRGGCSNVTAGTYRMTVYPDTVNMLGDTVVHINGPCFDKPGGDPPQLFIGENHPASCRIKNSAIAECRMEQFYQWGVKDLFLKYAGSKAYVGTIFYAPVGLDPYGLMIDDLPNLFQNPPPQKIILRWYSGNFTGHNSKLRLTLYAYEEVKDAKSRKFVNTMQKILEIDVPLGGYSTTVKESYVRSHDLTRSDIWNMLSVHSAYDISRYSFGVLKLGNDQKSIWSPPIPFHWLWSPKDVLAADQPAIISEIAAQSCLRWFDDDGTQWNFVQHTEYNASCPCLLKQAYADFGRFMPHPRCSRKFRNVGCDAYVGAHDCFLSAQNVISNFATHYGQVCCYDENGYLMQTAYASVKPHTAMDTIEKPLPYNPGFPQRAYELGTPSFHKQYETPILSNYFHDVMPYYMCCKWTVNRCQFFYWRRPSSGCQEYQSPKIASVFGAGHFTTLQNSQFTVRIDGIFTYFHKASDHLGPEVTIQIRLEKYPNRQVDPSHRNTLQENLVEPTDSVVVTGVSVQEGSGGDTDRVIILCRKDTRRFKYRTSVLVNDEIRYFDTMKMQKFRSVMIYINDVREGQSEVYVTLLKSKIGLRIRESFGYVIGLQPIFEESMGLLDVQLSVPPEYFQIPNNSSIVGLANRMGDPTVYKVDETTYTNLFTLKNSDHKDWPESSLLKPIYKFTLLRSFSIMEDTNRLELFHDSTQIPAIVHHCLAFAGQANCPSINIMLEANETCSANNWCIFDVMTVFQKQIGARTLVEFSEEKRLRNDMENRSISCAAINIQYPEYLYMEPARGGYLHGDNVQFLCFQNSWLKGDDYYQCRYGQWTKGSQPWCRERSLEFTFRYLAVIFGILLGILFIASIFLCCYCVGKKKRLAGSAFDRPVHPTTTVQPKMYDDDSAAEHEPPISIVKPSHAVRYKTHTSLKLAEVGSSPKSWTFTAV